MKYLLSENGARKLKKIFNGSMSVGRAATASSRPFVPDDFAAPWTVRYSASLNEGEGAWIVWLPTNCWIGAVPDDDLDPASGLPSGWYELPDDVASVLDSTVDSWVKIIADGSSGSITFSTPTAGSETSGIVVAEVKTDSSGARRINQIARSVIGGESEARGCFEVSADREEFVNCYYNVGGKTKVATTLVSPKISGTEAGSTHFVVLEIAADGLTSQMKNYSTFSAVQTAQGDMTKYTHLLYKLTDDGGVVIDFRNAPQIQQFELS